MVAAENRDKQASESLWLLSLPVDEVDRVVALVKKRGGKGQVYRHHHDYGSRWGDRIYDRDRIIVVPRDVAPAIEATPLPSEPDMGMPDMGGDMRGDDI